MAMMEMLATSGLVRGIITVLFVAICLLLIVVILLQKGRGGGLAGAFGGAGGHSAFGTKTGDVFTWVTVALAAMFVIVAIIGNFTMVPDGPPEVRVPAFTEPGAMPDGAPFAPVPDEPAEQVPVEPADEQPAEPADDVSEPVEEPAADPPLE
jgi:preprotein translocase subunit SecG